MLFRSSGLIQYNKTISIASGSQTILTFTQNAYSAFLAGTILIIVSSGAYPDGVATLDTNGYVPMSQLVNLINNAPANLDTLGEIYNYMLDREIDIIMGAA